VEEAKAEPAPQEVKAEPEQKPLDVNAATIEKEEKPAATIDFNDDFLADMKDFMSGGGNTQA
jgi:hypothetical protein